MEKCAVEGKMGTVTRVSKHFRFGVFLLAAQFVALLGCQGTMMSFKGAKVHEGYLIPLADGVQKTGNYQSRDLVIDYQLLRNKDELQISGMAQFASRLRNGFTSIPYFHLSVFLADAQGAVLANRGIGTSGYGRPDDDMRFNDRIMLPPGTAYMAFGYSGEARDNGGGHDDGGAVEISFWEYPVSR
jgi:hypothetical protein